MTAAGKWLRRHDPRRVVVRRAARVTLVACLGFSVGRYGLGDTDMAPYGAADLRLRISHLADGATG